MVVGFPRRQRNHRYFAGKVIIHALTPSECVNSSARTDDVNGEVKTTKRPDLNEINDEQEKTGTPNVQLLLLSSVYSKITQTAHTSVLYTYIASNND